jgi:hypothetical protein
MCKKLIFFFVIICITNTVSTITGVNMDMDGVQAEIRNFSAPKQVNVLIELICDCGRVNAAKGKPCTCKKKNEKIARNLEKQIVDDINNNTEYGLMIKDKFLKQFGKNIVSAKHIGGKKHHDILLICDDGSNFRCELKSSKKQSPSNWITPWQYAAQFLNGTGDKWRIRRFYAQAWYNKLPEIKTKYKLTNDIPPFDEWWKSDANMGSVKTAFGKEFKETVSAKERGKIKEKFVSDLVVPDEEIKNLLEDYLRESKLVLEEKDCWLVVSDSHKDIKVFDRVEPEKITKIYRKKSKDLVFGVESKIFKEIRVRWQNNNGIANISVQCK